MGLQEWSVIISVGMLASTYEEGPAAKDVSVFETAVVVAFESVAGFVIGLLGSSETWLVVDGAAITGKLELTFFELGFVIIDEAW